MIRFLVGNMFENNADCLINTVNLEGHMGKGVAYQFKQMFPNNNKQYIKDCKSGVINIGKVTSFLEKGYTIINFPTKNRWREDSKMEYIEKGLDSFLELLPILSVKTIAIPSLGCGNGGLNWNVVRKLIADKIKTYENSYDFLIFEPSINYKPVILQEPKMTTSSLVLLKLRTKLLRFNKIRLQKVSYFVNLFYGKDYFKFKKYKYGPYSHDIDIVAKTIREYQEYYKFDNSEDTYDSIYRTICSDNVNKQLEKLDKAINEASAYVNAIEDDKMLEGVSTVLYLIVSEEANTSYQIIDEFKSWSKDKDRRFSESDITSYIEYLEDTGLISQNFAGYELTTKALYA